MGFLTVCMIIVIVVFVLVVLAANLLFDFALNPSSPFSMKRLLHAGKVQDVSSSLFSLDNPVIARSYDFFEKNTESCSVVSDDGFELFGYVIKPSSSDAHMWAITCHGYTGKPKDMAPYALHFYEMGMGVVMPAARGHERNEHTGPVQMGYRDSRDLPKWIKLIASMDADASILLMGVSMGGAEVMMASGLDLPAQVKLIVEDCGYTGVWDEFSYQAKRMFKLPAFPVLNVCSMISSLRAGFSFKEASSVDNLCKATVPMLFIHGTKDAFVPFFMVSECAKAYSGPLGKVVAIEGAGHGEAALKDGETYWREVDAFIAENF